MLLDVDFFNDSSKNFRKMFLIYKCISLLSSGFSYIHMVRTGFLQGWPAPRDILVPLQYPDIVLCVLQRGGGSFSSCGRKFTHPVTGK